jgi:hypothetical protein
MIKRSLEYLSEELAFGIGVSESDVSINNLNALQNENAQGIVVSLLNVEEETTLKNTPHVSRKNERLMYKEPPVYLNLNVLLAFEFENYGTSLQRLEDTVQFFQNKRLFTSENERVENPFPAGAKKLILDLQQLNFEHLNHIWSISGGTHFLSLFYKIRLVKIEPQQEMEAPLVDTIQLNSGRI